MKVKWILKTAVLAFLILILGAIAMAETEIIASGYCGANGSDVQWTLDSDGLLTISGTGTMKDDYNFNHPPVGTSYYQQVTSLRIEEGITALGRNAFFDYDGLTEVIIPEGVERIGEYAFNGCSNLKKLSLPSTLSYVGPNTFSISINEVNVPSLEMWLGPMLENTKFCDILYLGINKLYINGERVRDIVIPSSITQIRNNGFLECDSLTSVKLHNNITLIGESAFEGCENLVAVNIPESVNSIGNYAFRSTDLTSIRIPGSVKAIGDMAFYSCDKLKSVTIGNGVENIGERTFGFCNNLTSIRIPGSVKSIGDYAFSSCYGLDSVTIGNGVENIGNEAFAYCSNFGVVTIPASVTAIGDKAFYKSNGNMAVCFLHSNAPEIGLSAFPSGSLIFCYEGSGIDGWAENEGFSVSYKTDADLGTAMLLQIAAVNPHPDAARWELPVTVFPDAAAKNIAWTSSDPSVAVVKDGIVVGLSGGKASITAACGELSDSVEITVPEPASILRIPASAKTIKAEAFANTDAEFVIIPESCTSIAEKAFAGSNLKLVRFLNSNIAIADDAFSGCSDMVFVCAEGSEAAAFADANTIFRIAP